MKKLQEVGFVDFTLEKLRTAYIHAYLELRRLEKLTPAAAKQLIDSRIENWLSDIAVNRELSDLINSSLTNVPEEEWECGYHDWDFYSSSEEAHRPIAVIGLDRMERALQGTW